MSYDDGMSDYDTDVESEKDVEFSVLTHEDIQARIDEAASETASLLSVTMPEAVVLLSKYGWNPSRIYDEWFSDEVKTRKNLTNVGKLKCNHALRSYVESRKNMKWCPYPGCEFALECIGTWNSHLDVTCKCSHSFCWHCSEESHSPSGCNLVPKWTSLISKNSEKARNDLNERYIHCHERWTENQRLRSKAMKRMKEFTEKHFKTLSESHLRMTTNQLQLITEAWAQIAECRRILKWSYVYGYYIPDEEPSKRDYFEFRRWNAEANLEKFHDLVENEGLKHISEAEANLNDRAGIINNDPAELAAFFTAREEVARVEFRNFLVRVTNHTKNIRPIFDILVKALANDLYVQEKSDS